MGSTRDTDETGSAASPGSGRSLVGMTSVPAVIAFAPFLLIYLLVHTKYLQAYLPEAKSGQVLVLLGLPAAWCALVLGLAAWWRRRPQGAVSPS